MDNPGKSWKSHAYCREILTTALRNSVMNVSSECVDHFHYYNQLELLLLILVCIHMSCFVNFGKNVVPIGHGNLLRLVLESHGKVMENDFPTRVVTLRNELTDY